MQISGLKKWMTLAFPFLALLGLYVGLGAVACQTEGRGDLLVAGEPARARGDQVNTVSQGAAQKESAPESDGQSQPNAAKDPQAPKTPETEEPKAPSAADLTVRRLVVTSRIEGREPAAVSSFTADGEPILAFVELKNSGEHKQRIVITFEHEGGQRVGNIELGVPASTRRWRTWGKTRQIKSPGRWTAVIRSADGVKLAEQPFVVDMRS